MAKKTQDKKRLCPKCSGQLGPVKAVNPSGKKPGGRAVISAEYEACPGDCNGNVQRDLDAAGAR